MTARLGRDGPAVRFVGDQIHADLPVEGETDETWRRLFNGAAATWDPPVVAEARGSEGRTLVTVVLPRSTLPAELADQVGRAVDLIAVADERYRGRINDEAPFHLAVARWWDSWRRNHPGYGI